MHGSDEKVQKNTEFTSERLEQHSSVVLLVTVKIEAETQCDPRECGLCCVFDFRRYRVFDANGNVGFCVVLFFTSVRLELFPGEIQGVHPTGRDRQIKKCFFTLSMGIITKQEVLHFYGTKVKSQFSYGVMLISPTGFHLIIII